MKTLLFLVWDGAVFLWRFKIHCPVGIPASVPFEFCFDRIGCSLPGFRGIQNVLDIFLMGTAPARMGVPGDFPGIFIQGYGFDFDGVGTFVVQQGDGVFAGRFDQFGNVKRMFLPGHGGWRPCADPGRIEKVRFVYLADDVPGKLDPHQIHTLAIRFQAFFEIRKILFTGGSPADFRKGAGTGECLVVQAFRCGNPFRPYLGAQSLDSGLVLFLQPGENGFEPVCLLDRKSVV